MHVQIKIFYVTIFLVDMSKFMLELLMRVLLQAFVEVYDLIKDPHQLTNIVKQMKPQELEASHTRLKELATCTGSSCS